MPEDTDALYAERFTRYTTAMRNGKPDKVPIRPFVAEFTAAYTGRTCQQVTHDYTEAFDAVIECCRDFDWDAAVANMVYVWSGLTEAVGLEYYGVPGIHIGPQTGFQYREPPEEAAYMRPEEYDALIEDPTGYLLNVWLPRVSRDVVPPGEPNTTRNNLSFLKGGMATLQYFTALGGQVQRMREETGTVNALAGILKAPMDILADKLRGYLGLVDDVLNRPEKVKAACEALAPHLAHVAATSADPSKTVPITMWMHRSCVPFFSFDHVADIHWATLKPIIQYLTGEGWQVMFYAEGKWGHHLDRFAELPDASVIYHCDRDDIFEVHRRLGEKFCISGGVPNALLAFGTPDQVRARCKAIIDGVAADGGYIMDAGAIIQNDAKPENVQAMTEFTREYGVY